MKKNLNFSVRLWRYPGDAAWYFLSVPKKESEMIRTLTKGVRRGWGSVRVRVKVGKTSWDTSVFPDSRSGVFLLPVKATVRRAEGMDEGDTIRVLLGLR